MLRDIFTFPLLAFSGSFWTSYYYHSLSNREPPGLFIFCVTLSRFHSYHSQIRRSEFSDCFFGRSDVCPDTMWGDVFALWFSHLWKIYIGSINSWLAVRTFSLTLVCLRDFASVCATRMSTLNWSWYFEKWISDNTYIFPEDCSNHLDEKIFCPLQDIKDF